MLAVEDEPGVLAAVVENLTDLGYRVIPARDAAEALERLRGEERVDVEMYLTTSMTCSLQQSSLKRRQNPTHISPESLRYSLKKKCSKEYIAKLLRSHHYSSDPHNRKWQ